MLPTSKGEVWVSARGVLSRGQNVGTDPSVGREGGPLRSTKMRMVQLEGRGPPPQRMTG